MKTYSTIRKVLRALVASLFAAAISAVWPLSAQAGKSGGGGHVQTHNISVSKTVDKASPNLYRSTAKGTHYNQVTIEMRKAGGDPNTSGKPYATGAGKVKFNEFTVKKTTDKASPAFFQ